MFNIILCTICNIFFIKPCEKIHKLFHKVLDDLFCNTKELFLLVLFVIPVVFVPLFQSIFSIYIYVLDKKNKSENKLQTLLFIFSDIVGILTLIVGIRYDFLGIVRDTTDLNIFTKILGYDVIYYAGLGKFMITFLLSFLIYIILLPIYNYVKNTYKECKIKSQKS